MVGSSLALTQCIRHTVPGIYIGLGPDADILAGWLLSLRSFPRLQKGVDIE